MWSVKTRPKPGSNSLAARSFSDVGVAVGWMSNFTLMALLPAAAVSGAGISLRACWAELLYDMGSLPDWRGTRAWRLGAVEVAWTSPAPAALTFKSQDLLEP